MADGIIRKSIKGGTVTVRFTASGFIKPNTAGAVTGANSAGEVIQAMNIAQVYYSTSNGAFFTVARGGNTVLVLSGSGDHDYQTKGIQVDCLGGEPQANLVVTKTGAGPSSLVIQLHKRVAITGGSAY